MHFSCCPNADERKQKQNKSDPEQKSWNKRMNVVKDAAVILGLVAATPFHLLGRFVSNIWWPEKDLNGVRRQANSSSYWENENERK